MVHIAEKLNWLCRAK